LKKYRLIEVNAFRRRVTIVSGEWPRDISESPPAHTDDGISLNDSDVSEPVETDSPEGQLILVEAMRSMERRLSPEARAMIYADQNTPLEWPKPKQLLSQLAVLVSTHLRKSIARGSKGQTERGGETISQRLIRLTQLRSMTRLNFSRHKTQKEK
jgi:hypothetical protein